MDTEVSQQVLRALREIVRAMDIHSRRRVQEHGLTRTQLAVLRALADLGEIPVGKLAEAVRLSPATLTGAVDRLEKRGVVQRVRSERDRRIVFVALLQPGRTMLEAAPPRLHKPFSSRFAELTDWEKVLILSSLQRVADMMQGKGVGGSILESSAGRNVARVAVDCMPGARAGLCLRNRKMNLEGQRHDSA